MGFPTSSIDSITRLVVDTSTIINLNATGCAERILQALPAKVIVVDVILGELDEGRPHGRPDADMLRELVASGIIEIVALGDESAEHFEKLVVGPAVRGRMSVLPRDVEWVVGLIGSDKAAACTSLPGCARCHDASPNISNPQRK